MFKRSDHLSDKINDQVIQSEIEGGVALKDLPEGTLLEVLTKSRIYHLEVKSDGKVLILGHPKYCPDPVLVYVNGSTWGGSMLKTGFIGRGMHMEFCHPEFGTITTSAIQDIEEVSPI